MRNLAALVRSYLGNHDNASYLFYRLVVGRGDPKNQACDLNSEIADANELLEDVLWKHISEARLSDVIGIDVDLLGPQMKRRSCYGSHSPVCLGHELFFLVLARDLGHNLSAVHVSRLHSLGLKRGCLLVLFLDPLDLLLLNVDRGDLHSEDDVFDLRLREARHVHVVLLGVVCQNEIL